MSRTPGGRGLRIEVRICNAYCMALDLPPSQPTCMLITGLPGTGKSTIADQAAELLGAPVLAHDWAMSGLRPFEAVQSALDEMVPSGHQSVGWSMAPRRFVQSSMASTSPRPGGCCATSDEASSLSTDAF